MLYIYDIMKFNPANERKLQKREGPRGDRMGPIKWKYLDAQIGQREELLEVAQLVDHHRRIAMAPQQQRLVQNDRKPQGRIAGEYRLARHARLHPGVHAAGRDDLRRVRALFDRLGVRLGLEQAGNDLRLPLPDLL